MVPHALACAGSIKQDRRPGGVCEMTFHGPDGELEPQNGIYLAWDEGRRFATTDAVTGDLMPSGPFMIGIWEIEPEGDGTRYTARSPSLERGGDEPARGNGLRRWLGSLRRPAQGAVRSLIRRKPAARLSS